VSTPLTGSEKVTDHCTDPVVLVGELPRRMIDADGAVRSITQVYDVVADFDPEIAFT
jgi:hypothetical protein